MAILSTLILEAHLERASWFSALSRQRGGFTNLQSHSDSSRRRAIRTAT